MLRLYTFVGSHFSEKARWALDHGGIAYDETHLLPGPHVLTVRWFAKKTTVPLLVDGATAIQGSSAIIDYAESKLGARHLTPESPTIAERSRSLEALADEAFGLGTLRIVYAALLERPNVLIDLWTQRGPRWAPALYRLAWPVMRRVVRRNYRLHSSAVEHAKAAFLRAMDETDRLLLKTPYLLGDEPTRVDLAVASLLAMLLHPSGHLVAWPREIPDELAAFVREVEGRPTCSFVHRMYRDHRRATIDRSAPTQVPAIVAGGAFELGPVPRPVPLPEPWPPTTAPSGVSEQQRKPIW